MLCCENMMTLFTIKKYLGCLKWLTDRSSDVWVVIESAQGTVMLVIVFLICYVCFV